ncbi:FtsW/RodA/SpoVE family cell cycle protein [Patescibacteria group bacterium]|nr:FtsW/RodA/SpoVE family cell cycle protein [Patescibacteria group bacterium]
MRKYFLLGVLFLFTVLSLTTLRSIVPELLYKQAISFGLAFLVFFVTYKLPFAFHLKISKWLYLLLNLSLLFLLIYGSITRGISAWIVLPFGFKFQPSQLAIPITTLYLLNSFVSEKKFDWFLLFKTLLIIALPAILILLEPDFGTVLVFVSALSVFLIFNRLNFKQILFLFSGAFLILMSLWFLVFKDYQKNRVLSFLNLNEPSISQEFTSQESSSAYNARQALIAVGSGKFWGRGIGQGVQSHLRFLPERQTDFIFASFAEEWGFVGAIFLLALYFSLLFFLLYLAYQVNNFPEKIYLLVLFVMFLVQTFINIGMNLAILPITGITLPLLSYGGSSVISLFFALGIAQSIATDFKKKAIYNFY